jgi:hypothetical protein
MVITSISSVRLAISIFALVAGLLFATGIVPGNLNATLTEPPCEFDDGSDEWACAETPHIFQGHCEGIDCYSSMEFCCVIFQ